MSSHAHTHTACEDLEKGVFFAFAIEVGEMGVAFFAVSVVGETNMVVFLTLRELGVCW